MKRLAIFVSGTGSLLEAMIKGGLEISFVLADRDCRGYHLADPTGIPAMLLQRASFGPKFNRKGYTLEVVKFLRYFNIDLVAMAGFMTILDPVIFDEGYEGKILNTHPSLLPFFKGDHAVRDTLAAGAGVAGCTIHVATEELDAGPILAQASVPVLPGDTKDTLHERIKVVERELYPKTILEYMKTLK